MLPIRLEFNSDMHPAYYLTQVANLHAYPSLSDMVNAFNLKMPNNYNGNIERFNDIIQQITGIKVQLTERYGFDYDVNRHITSLVHTGVNICPCCLEERKVDFDNRYVTSSYCREHKCKTEQVCQQCGSELKWDKTLLKGCCGHCGLKIETRHSVCPSYQTFLDGLSPTHKSLFLDDLTLAIGFVLRPFDIVPERVKRNVVSDWGATLELAFALLTDLKVIENWFANIVHMKGNEFSDTRVLFAGPRYLQRNLKLSWPLAKFVDNVQSSTTFELLNELKSIHPSDFGLRPFWKTKGLTHEEQDRQARNKCSIDVVSDILGCSSAQVATLIENGNLKPLRTVKTGVTTLVDIQEISTVLSSLKVVDCFDDEEPLLSSNFLTMFYCNRRDVIELVKMQPSLFKVAKSTGALISRLRLTNRKKYLKCIVSLFKNRLSEKVSEEDAITMFGFTRKDLRALWQQELAFVLPWQQYTAYFRLADLVNIDKKVFNLKRYCLVKGINFEEVSAILSCNDINPIAGDSLYQCKAQVLTFLKKGKLIEAVNQFKPKLINDWFWMNRKRTI